MIKRIAFIIGFSALWTACDNGGEDWVRPPTEKTGISFERVQTRAPLQTVSNTFALYGTATHSGKRSVVFNNQKVDYNAGTNTWEYFPLKYWDVQADHKFAAYVPYHVSRNFSFSAEGYPLIENFMVQQNVDTQESLLLSRSVERSVGTGGLDMSAVTFTFDPALTRINFKIKKDASVSGVLSLNGLRMYNLKSSGNCIHNGTRIVWDTSSAPTNVFGYSTSFPSAREVPLEGFTAWQNGLLMVPQQISGITVYLSYTHRPNDVTYSYDKDNITLPGVDWEPGKQITYVLTLKPENYIEIGEPIVEPWIEGSTNGGTIIIN